MKTITCSQFPLQLIYINATLHPTTSLESIFLSFWGPLPSPIWLATEGILYITFPWNDGPSSTDIKPLILLFEERGSFSTHTHEFESTMPSLLRAEMKVDEYFTQHSTPLLWGLAWPASWKDVDLILLVPTLEFLGNKEFFWEEMVSKRPPGTCKSLSNPVSQHRVSFVRNQGGSGGSSECRAARDRKVPSRAEKSYSTQRKRKDGEWQSQEVRQGISKLLLAIGCRNIWKKNRKIINWL